MNFLNKQIPFVYALKQKAFVSLILGGFLSMIIIFLEPFDTNEYESNYRLLMLSGFGILVSCVCFLQCWLENIWYVKVNKVWVIRYEIVSTFFFFCISGTVIYLYNHMVINGFKYSLQTHWWYCTHIVLAMVPIIAPVLAYLRQKFGEYIIPKSPDTIFIIGKNKNETLELKKDALLYVQSVENYIEIYFIDSDKKLHSKTFRQTLSQVHEQLIFLEKCHRSYLVNKDKIDEVQGNSQSAKISFQHIENKIPLSKTFYKTIKTKIS